MTRETMLLGGRYEVAELIGRGGMAEVHLGHDTRLGRQVAIKMLRSDLARRVRPRAAGRQQARRGLPVEVVDCERIPGSQHARRQMGAEMADADEADTGHSSGSPASISR